jgi:phosphohistidine phosphatase
VKTLVLIRHAQAEPMGPDDAARSLTRRGQSDATAINRWLKEERIVPDRVVVSTSRRTRETWALAGVVPPVYDDRLYDASLEDLREVVRDTAPGVETLVLVGHNPSIEQLAWALDDSPAAREIVDRGLPPSTVVIVDATDWDLGRTAVRKVATPRG